MQPMGHTPKLSKLKLNVIIASALQYRYTLCAKKMRQAHIFASIIQMPLPNLIILAYISNSL